MMCRYKGLVIETSRGHRSMLIRIPDIGHMDVMALTGMMDTDMGTGIMTAMVALAAMVALVAMVEATADMTVTITVVMDTTVDMDTMLAYLVLQFLPRRILAVMATEVVEAPAVVQVVAQVVVMVAATHQARRQLHGHLQTMVSLTKCSK